MASPPPSPNPAPNPSEKEALLTNEMESVDFASLLADLESMPHTNINARPIGKAGSRKPNDFGVRVTLQLQPRKQKRFAVTKGGARLQMLPPSLIPPPRATSSDAVSDTTRRRSRARVLPDESSSARRDEAAHGPMTLGKAGIVPRIAWAASPKE